MEAPQSETANHNSDQRSSRRVASVGVISLTALLRRCSLCKLEIIILPEQSVYPIFGSDL